jgi:hypothetical protein
LNTMPAHQSKRCTNKWRTSMLDWIKNKIKERDSLHGAGIIIACLLIIAFGSMAKILAYVGIAYGVWQILKKD